MRLRRAATHVHAQPASAATTAQQRSPPLTVTVDLDHRPPLTFYLSVGLVAGSIIALQIGIMRVFSVGSWAHFGSLVVSLAMFGFGLTSAVMCVGKGWFERHWLRRRQGRAAGLRAADGGVQPRRPAGAVQRHLPGLRPDAEVAAARQLRALFPAVPGGRALSRRRLPEGAEDLQPRLLRRSRGLGPVRAVRAAGACTVFRPDDLIMAPLLLWLAGGVLWFVALGDRRGIGAIVDRRGAVGRRALRGAAGARHPQARGVGLQGRVLRPQVPRQPAHLRARLAVRLPGGLFQLLPAFRAGPVGQRRLQPAEHAGQRLSRPLHRLARARRASSRTCRPSETPISATCRCTTLRAEAGRPRPSSCSSAAASRPRWR